MKGTTTEKKLDELYDQRLARMGVGQRYGPPHPRSRDDPPPLRDPSWKLWFGEEDEVRDGGPDDSRLVLIDVDVDSVVYMKADAPRPLQLFQVAKGFTGKEPDIGEVKRLDGSEMHGRR